MPDPYYSHRGPWQARWPVSRVARYLFTFLLGAFAGAGLAARLTGHRTTSYGSAATDPPDHELPATAFRAPSVEHDLEGAIRDVLRAELHDIECRFDAMEASLATIAQSALAKENERSLSTADSSGPLNADSAVANRSRIVARKQEHGVGESTLSAAVENKVVNAINHRTP